MSEAFSSWNEPKICSCKRNWTCSFRTFRTVLVQPNDRSSGSHHLGKLSLYLHKNENAVIVEYTCRFSHRLSPCISGLDRIR